MWLITTLIAALVVTAAGFVVGDKYKTRFLSLMLWGASLMIFVDHVLGFDGSEFIHMTTEGMITDGTVLGIAMLIPIFLIWELYIIISMKRGGK